MISTCPKSSVVLVKIFLVWFVVNISCVVIGRAKRALHTGESQLRSDVYMFISQKFKGQCVSIPAAMFKRQH